MSIERALYARLTGAAAVSAIIGTRLFPNFAPLGTAAPFAIYNRVSANRIRSLTQRSGLAMVRMQVDCMAETYAGARALADVVRQALDGFRGEAGSPPVMIESCSLQSDQDLYEDAAEPPLHRVSMDFMLTHREE
jgi:hypothetical protein